MKDYIEQIPDYLAHNLSKTDRDAFEMALLEDGELQSAVMIEQALKQGLGNLDAKPSPQPAAPKRSSPAVRWAVAVSLVLGLSLYLNLSQKPESGITSVDQIVYIEPMRSTALQSYSVDAGTPTLLSVAVSDPRAEEVLLEIRSDSYEAPGKYIAVNRDGLVNVLVPELSPGAYELTLKSEFFEDAYALELE